MKKCPNCDRKFDDSMRFCQTDGTPLVEDAPAVDPYKTMVASTDDIRSAMGTSDQESSMKVDDEVLQLPTEADPRKTMYASEEEIRKEMEARDEQVVDLPPLAPDPPKFSEPSLNAPSFGDLTPSAPPPSPFGAAENDPIGNPTQDSPFSKTTPPIPSPFDKPKASTYEPQTEYKPAQEPEPFDRAQSNPFDTPAAAPMEPASQAPAQSWQAPEPMQNAPMSAAGAGQNKTLAIVSLVLGILSIPCCGVLTGVPAIIVGIIAKNKVNSNPSEFGGAGLALGGIITGVLGTIIGIILIIVQVFLGGLNALMNIPS